MLRIVEGPPFAIAATSYGREAPSGLGVFSTKHEAETAMLKLQAHLDTQRGKKEVSKKAIRKQGDA